MARHPDSLLFPIYSVVSPSLHTHPKAGRIWSLWHPLPASHFPRHLLSTPCFCWFISFLFSFTVILLGFRGTRENRALALLFYPEVKNLSLSSKHCSVKWTSNGFYPGYYSALGYTLAPGSCSSGDLSVSSPSPPIFPYIGPTGAEAPSPQEPELFVRWFLLLGIVCLSFLSVLVVVYRKAAHLFLWWWYIGKLLICFYVDFCICHFSASVLWFPFL